MRTVSRHEIRLLVLAVAVLVPVGFLGIRAALTPETTDFRCFWTGAAFVLNGQDPYDVAEWTRATSGVTADVFGQVRQSNCPGRYGYPLTTAIAMLPFGALPLALAAAIWEFVLFAGAVAGAALLAHAARLSRSLGVALVVLVFASQPFEQTLISGQFGGLSLLALGLLAAPKLGPIHSGGAVLLAALKPHAIPLVPLVRARGERARTIAIAALPVTLVVLASLAVQPTWPVSWIGELGGQRREMFAASVSLWTLATAAGTPMLAPALVAMGLVPMAVAARRARELHVLDVIAVVALGWLLVVPYGLTSDQLAPLSAAWVAILRRAVTPTVSLPLVIALLAVAGLLPWALYAVRYDVLPYRGLDLIGALVPLVTAAVLACALARSPHVVTRMERSANPAVTSP